jgi:hypothetical protein
VCSKAINYAGVSPSSLRFLRSQYQAIQMQIS